MVRLTGEMDISRVDEVRALLLEAMTRTGGRADIVVDLSGLTFCDSAGLNLLLRARLQAKESGRTLRLAAPSAQMLRLLEITGSLALFPVDTAPPGSVAP
ncbi:STAS domain-containing protein [Streptomyces sp. ZAF1911]|uniref:STAS domain-containing protein n=1 Tax=Streptomyces sp. ZAF1911 TaxID=2944129 RepID=UPI00237B31B8|nr:STAS domain-containing protein [Streptomyces sp. ZAF1911]MDD9375443.1 STAS domain-containing protein [Streptomyces sp. ZAF1911]